MPFRRAHHVTGRIVRLAEERGCDLADLPLDAMQAVEPGITGDVFLGAQRRGVGREPHQLGRQTAPARVAEAAQGRHGAGFSAATAVSGSDRGSEGEGR